LSLIQINDHHKDGMERPVERRYAERNEEIVETDMGRVGW
jgi:hypothetical protein